MSVDEIADSDVYLRQSLTFEQGKTYMITAGSGRGKTSLLNFIYGSSSMYDGEIVHHGSDSDNTSLRRSRLSYMFQDLRLFDNLTARENIEIKNRLTNHKTAAEIEQMLLSVLPASKIDVPANTLSLGQKQRVAAVRALCQPFCFLLLDEPFSHLDNKTAELLSHLIANEVKHQEAGMIITALDPICNIDFDKTLRL